MPFTGKATYTAGAALPELSEDVSDLVELNSAFETPLLDALGDPPHPARSTVHEWLEDELVATSDRVSSVSSSTELEMSNVDRFRVGDQLRVHGSSELLLVTGISGDTITVARGYGGSATGDVEEDTLLHILGNAALEGGDAGQARVTARVRKANYTQIFSVTVEVSGSELAVRQIGVRDELDYQKVQRTRELIRDLENSVINGIAAGSDPQGSSTVRRTMRGILPSITQNVFSPGVDGFPSGTALTEAQLNAALRTIWEASNGSVDLLVMGGAQKRAMNEFIGSNRRFSADTELYKNLVSAYESDFGVCRVIVSRYMPVGTVLLLDSSRINVLPLAGRSFQYKPLARTGDRESGQLVGEYTVELRNVSAHGMITGLTG